jgi:enamine deaminase RidA (YjgF/YER057c/UK114 family)
LASWAKVRPARAFHVQSEVKIMEKTVLQPKTLHKPFSTYSHGIAVDGAKRIVFLAGQVAGTADGTFAGEGDFDAQGEQVMKNLRDVLAEAGAVFSDVVKLTTYVVRQEDAQRARDLVGKHFHDASPPPANTLCVLQELATTKFLIEIEAIAVL